jgi:hypothetical protein
MDLSIKRDTNQLHGHTKCLQSNWKRVLSTSRPKREPIAYSQTKHNQSMPIHSIYNQFVRGNGMLMANMRLHGGDGDSWRIHVRRGSAHKFAKIIPVRSAAPKLTKRVIVEVIRRCLMCCEVWEGGITWSLAMVPGKAALTLSHYIQQSYSNIAV